MKLLLFLVQDYNDLLLGSTGHRLGYLFGDIRILGVGILISRLANRCHLFNETEQLTPLLIT